MTAWNAERWHAATGELDVLLGRTAAERAAALDALRARDPRLADDVAKLLRDHESAQAGGFLEQGPNALLTTATTPDGDAGPAPRSSAALPPGTEFGGFGCVECSAAAAWASSTRPRRSRPAAASRSRSSRAALRRRARAGALRARGAPCRLDRAPALRVRVTAPTSPRRAGDRDGADAGQTLDDRISAEGRCRPPTAVDVAMQLLDGLAGRAAAGILHRDVKPSNCFLDADGTSRSATSACRDRSTRPGRRCQPAPAAARRPTPRPSSCAAPRSTRAPTSTAWRDALRARHRTSAVHRARSDVAPDGGGQRCTGAAAPRPRSRSARLEPRHPPLPGEAARGALRQLCRAGGSPRAVRSVSPTPATLWRRFIAGVVDQLTLSVLNLPIMLTLVVPVRIAPEWRGISIYMAATLTIQLLYLRRL